MLETVTQSAQKEYINNIDNIQKSTCLIYDLKGRRPLLEAVTQSAQNRSNSYQGEGRRRRRRRRRGRCVYVCVCVYLSSPISRSEKKRYRKKKEKKAAPPRAAHIRKITLFFSEFFLLKITLYSAFLFSESTRALTFEEFCQAHIVYTYVYLTCA
jgi:hypothetical protein